ncbi:hypothetical protein ACV56Z_11825 [Staphylococcus aureus]
MLKSECGALFMGHYSPEVIGDYVCRSDHYLQIEQLDLPMGYGSMIA